MNNKSLNKKQKKSTSIKKKNIKKDSNLNLEKKLFKNKEIKTNLNIKLTTKSNKNHFVNFENKYYGVSQVNSRGQIVLPKTARNDLNISHKDQLILLIGSLPHSHQAFLLIKAEDWYKMPNNAPLKQEENHKFGGIIKMAERGQIVIPKSVRNEFNIKKGVPILILSHKKLNGIILALLNQERINQLVAGIF